MNLSRMLGPGRRFWLGLFLVLSAGFGLSARAGEIEVLRDGWGTPHVFAEAERDGFFGLGYAAAEDRLLQMELIRRKAAGRLAEVFGPDWVDADREARIAGHVAYAPRAFAKLPERWQEALRAYASGVNAWRQANRDAVTRRFQTLGIQPEPWTPADCLLAARGILSLGSPFSAAAVEDDRRFRERVAQVGEAEAARQSGLVIDDSAAIVSESEMAKDKAAYERLQQRPRMPGFDLRPAGGGEEPRKMSHAWAVSGRKSTTGKPILESDPQLALSSPPFFYEIHLAAGRIDARGLGIPGCPGLFIGWTRRIAWGASALGVDSHVTFLDRLTPDGQGYLFEEQPVAFERRLEQIEVKDGPPVVQEVLTSRHGTVFNSLVRSPRAGEAYLCYDAQTMNDGASARMMLEVMDAGNWSEFRRALEHYYYPGLHIVYADIEGNVGYQTLVHRPLTTRSPRRALEGWTGRDEVRGRIPFDELPHLLNPDSGYLSHANNLPVGSWYPYDLGLATGGTGDTSRSLRLRQLLDGDQKFSVDDFERVLHRDDVNPLVAALLPVARQVVEEDKVADPAVLRLLDAVKGWDRHDGTTDRFPAARGLRNTLTPYRGSGLQNVYGAGGGGIAHLARAVGARFARDGSTPTNKLVRAYLVNWLRASATGGGGGRSVASDESTAPRSQGRPAAARDAGRTIVIPYQRTIPHNLPVVDASLDLVSPPLTCLDQGTIWSQPGNLYSQIVDLADADNSRSMMAPGNAEAGPFRTNQVDLWVRGTTHPAPLSRAKLEALGTTRTKLTAIAYAGPTSSPARTVTETDRATRFIGAMPPVAASTNSDVRPLPGRKPDDPTLEAAFRIILRQGTAPEEVDAKLAECRDYVKGNTGLTEQLRSAAVLGVYLIEESAAGRLKVPYGSSQVLERLKALLKDLGGNERSHRGESTTNQWESQRAASLRYTGTSPKPHGRMEEMAPDELERVLEQAPIAFVPLGTFEHHGWHLPVCFDGIKAHALCERVAQRTGGTVLPTFFYGTGGGHVGYKWTLMLPEAQITPLIEATLDHLTRQGFKVMVLLTGHYPKEQVDMVHRLAREAQGRHPRAQFIGLTEPEVTTPQAGDAYGGDHAAKYETSIALALNPGWVHLDRLTAGRDPAQATLPAMPRQNVSTHDPMHPLYAIYGQDPRTTASKELGEKLVAEIVSRLAGQVEEAWHRISSPPISPTAPLDRKPASPEPVTNSTNRGRASATPEGRVELAKWADAAKYRPQTGPGGAEWDAPYRSFIQTDESATAKGFPTHAEAARQILADAAKSPDNLRRHKGWVLFIKHFSQAYRPESATADLKRLYEDLVALESGTTTANATRPFEGDARLTIHRDVVYGRNHPEVQKLDAYLVKSAPPAPVVIEIHGGGWRRGSKSQFVYPGDLIGAILEAGISVVSIDYRLTPQHPMPAQIDDVVRAIQFVRFKANEWNLDPNRIAALGGSAGAHLGAWVALHDDLARPDRPDPVERLSSRLTCFVALSGPMDLTRVRPTELARQPLRGQDFANAFTAAFSCSAEQFENDPAVRRRIRDASPLFLVSADDPPGFLLAVAGEAMEANRHPSVPEVINDPHSAWHAVLLADALNKAGAKPACRIGPQVGKHSEADTAAIAAFLRHQMFP